MKADIIQHDDFETARDYQRIAQALTYVDANFQDQPSLTEIADQVGLSEFHFQRLFSRWVGISPKQFLKHLTLECAKRSLEASASVLDAAYDAGLSGPGRLHDLFVTCDAVTPGEYKARGEGMTIRYGSHPSPFGDCLLLVTDRGICGLAFTDENEPLPDALAYLSQGWENARIVEAADETQAYADRMFAPEPGGKGGKQAPLRVLLRGTEFQTRVWRALLTIPPGTLTTYEDIARRLGYTKNAARAVGRANATNMISYLVPCHRVIRKTGAIGGYRWGRERKLAMIGWEATRAEQAA
ncbi:MAG: methylated-DNA--[protein]-cysteine S-methyltransferase [Rhodospirillaceae bacterium]|nr:methylated-DNA--[protein]-cysteine S-methyltransferase [Rhodospirillaceae bacterium]